MGYSFLGVLLTELFIRILNSFLIRIANFIHTIRPATPTHFTLIPGTRHIAVICLSEFPITVSAKTVTAVLQTRVRKPFLLTCSHAQLFCHIWCIKRKACKVSVFLILETSYVRFISLGNGNIRYFFHIWNFGHFANFSTVASLICWCSFGYIFVQISLASGIFIIGNIFRGLHTPIVMTISVVAPSWCIDTWKPMLFSLLVLVDCRISVIFTKSIFLTLTIIKASMIIQSIVSFYMVQVWNNSMS